MTKRDDHLADQAADAFADNLAPRKAPPGTQRPRLWALGDWIERNNVLITLVLMAVPMMALTAWSYDAHGVSPITLASDWIWGR